LGCLLCRIAILATENKTVKQQLQTVLDKGRHDNELIEALLVCDRVIKFPASAVSSVMNVMFVQ